MSRNICLSLLLVTGLVGCVADDSMSGDDTAPEFTNGVSTLTGSAKSGWVDGPRGKARFFNPVNVIYGPDNKLYVADFDNDKIRVVDPESGDTTTLINQKNFARPFALAFGRDGTLWVSTDNNATGSGHSLMTGTIWRIDRGQNTAQMVIQNIGRPRGMVVLGDGRLAISDYMHHVVEILDPASNTLTTIAGTFDQKGMVDGAGAAARFSTPYQMVVRPDGKLLMADYDNNRLRVVGLDGSVSTLAGSSQGFADGAMADVKMNHPQGMAMASNGDIYFTDLGNFRVRKIVGETITTVAGDGMGGFGDNDVNLNAELYGLEGMTLKPDGSKLYVADGTRGENALPYHRIRVINNNQ